MTEQSPHESRGARRPRRKRVPSVAIVGLTAAVLGSALVLGVDHRGTLVSLASTATGHGSGTSATAGGSSGGSSSGGSSSGGSSSGGSSAQDPGGLFGGGSSSGDGTGVSSGSSSSGSTSSATGSPANVAALAAKVSPALVDINATYSYQSAAGAGTGVVLTSDGEVLTNNHVVEGATAIRVTDVGNGTTYTASVVGYDAAHDIAVLKLANASGLTTATIGDSSSVRVGDGVVAVGNAGGAGGTPSSAGGAITGLGQSVTAGDEMTGSSEQLTGMIGVNAAVLAGDSGGSLVNSSGEVIGIDTAGSSGSSGGFASQSSDTSQTQAYAVPINTALSIARQIESGQGSGTTHVGGTAFLGVSIASADTQGGLGQGGSGATGGTSGATIAGLVSGGAASRAGLAVGDTITALDGHTIGQPSDLPTVLARLHPGDRVAITWVDSSGASHSGSITLGSGPPA